MGQPRFTEDFTADAVKQITERGHSVSDVSQRLGVSTHSLYAWTKRYALPAESAAKSDQSVEIRRRTLGPYMQLPEFGWRTMFAFGKQPRKIERIIVTDGLRNFFN